MQLVTKNLLKLSDHVIVDLTDWLFAVFVGTK